MLIYLLIFAIIGSFLISSGRIYLSAKFKRPFSYSEVKELANKGNGLAKFLMWIYYLSILSAVLYGVLGISRFF